MRKAKRGRSIDLYSSCRIKKWETKGNDSKEKLIQDTDKNQSKKHDEKDKQDGRSKYKKQINKSNKNKMNSAIYRVIQEESALLWEMIVWVILSKKVHTNMGPILNGYGVMGIF